MIPDTAQLYLTRWVNKAADSAAHGTRLGQTLVHIHPLSCMDFLSVAILKKLGLTEELQEGYYWAIIWMYVCVSD